MGQTLVFEADNESPLTEAQVSRLGEVLRSLLGDDEGFERLRVEIEADSAFELGFQFVEQAGVEEGVEADEDDEGEIEAEAEIEEEELTVQELRERKKESGDLPTLNPGTRRYVLASVLYHADGYLTTPEIVELSEGEDWEMQQSGASAELYNMFKDYVVHRRKRGGEGPYEYWLTDDGIEVLEQSDATIDPNPFEEE